MIDFVYFHDNQLIVMYNKLKPKKFNQFTINDSGESLCLKRSEAKN